MGRVIWIVAVSAGLGCTLEKLDNESPAATLSRKLPNWSASCSACVRDECLEQLTECASDADCVEFVACRWGDDAESSPGAELACGLTHRTSPEDPLSATRKLSNCWQSSCVEACQLGTQWGCARSYAMPAPGTGSTIRVSQTVQEAFTDRPVAGASVRFCGLLDDTASCEEEYHAQAVTDASGMASVDLPVATDDRAGWRGYRHVSDDQGRDVLLQNNLPATVDRFMLQHVFTGRELDALAQRFAVDLAVGNIIFQVFDCAHTAAEGVRLHLLDAAGAAPLDAPSARVLYRRGLLELVEGVTDASSEGGGAVFDLPAQGLATLSARLEAADLEIARIPVSISAGRILLLEIHPEPGP